MPLVTEQSTDVRTCGRGPSHRAAERGPAPRRQGRPAPMPRRPAHGRPDRRGPPHAHRSAGPHVPAALVAAGLGVDVTTLPERVAIGELVGVEAALAVAVVAPLHRGDRGPWQLVAGEHGEPFGDVLLGPTSLLSSAATSTTGRHGGPDPTNDHHHAAQERHSPTFQQAPSAEPASATHSSSTATSPRRGSGRGGSDVGR